MAALTDSVARSPGPGAKSAIVQYFFDDDVTSRSLAQFDEYFRHYNREISILDLGTHNDILSIAGTLSRERRLARPLIRETLRSQYGDVPDITLNRSIDLTLRLLPMINVREACFKLQTLKSPSLQWDEVSTLEDFISRQFPVSKRQIFSRDGRLDPNFTVANMIRICGLKLEWTQSLEDHLRLNRRTKALRVFPYKCCLLGHSDDFESKQISLLPRNVVVETTQSLDLLFPHWDAKTDDLLRQHCQTFHRLGSFHSTSSLNLKNFDHWRDRLLELYEEVYQSPPVSWAQLWADRRNPLQWYTFWIALVILF
ncbi:hypothetical protein MMC17_006329 [Xylographa soralifera]|nr:hypothetical protein [Xylographa soralifera]